MVDARSEASSLLYLDSADRKAAITPLTMLERAMRRELTCLGAVILERVLGRSLLV